MFSMPKQYEWVVRATRNAGKQQCWWFPVGLLVMLQNVLGSGDKTWGPERTCPVSKHHLLSPRAHPFLASCPIPLSNQTAYEDDITDDDSYGGDEGERVPAFQALERCVCQSRLSVVFRPSISSFNIELW